MNLRRTLAAALAVTAGSTTLALLPSPPASASLADGRARFTRQEAGAQFQWSSPVVGVLGGTEVTAVGGMNGVLYAYRGDGSTLFATNLRAPLASSPAIGDVDGDGASEIVVGFGTENAGPGGVVILNAVGAERCRFNVPPRVDGLAGVFNAPAIADVNGDGSGDVVFGAFNDHIYAMGGNCRPFADFDNQDTVWSSPAAADVNGDGKAEVFIGGDATGGGQPHSGGFFRRLDFNGSGFVEAWQRKADETFQSSGAIGTINGRLAVVTQTGNDYCINRDQRRCVDARRVWAFDVNTGGDIAGWPVSLPSHSFLTAPALGDVNGDGATDVVAGSKDGNIRAYNGDGKTLWTRNIGDTDYVGSPIIADTDGAGTPEVIVAATPRAYVLNGATGAEVRRFSQGNTGLAHKNAAAVGVLGGTWVVVTAGFDPATGNTGWLSAFDIPTPRSAPWPMFKKNPRRLSADSTDPKPITCDSGYWLVAADGGIFSFGNSPFLGSTGDIALNQQIVGMTATPDRGGYQFVARDGGIFSFGNAGFFGSTGGTPLNKPIVGMAPTPSGKGYWLVASDGGIFAFGDATFFGSTGGSPLNQPIVGMAATPTGKGYWLVARDGGIFSFGDAEFLGSTGAITLNQPIVGMAAHPSGKGYWFVASDGGIFTFGTAPFLGSTGGTPLNKPVVGMRATPTGNGYWFVATDGGIFSFGDAEFCGSTGAITLNKPIVGMG